MHEMQTIVTDVRGICPVSQSVCHAAQLGFTVQGSFGAAFAKSLWSFVQLVSETHKVASKPSAWFPIDLQSLLQVYNNCCCV